MVALLVLLFVDFDPDTTAIFGGRISDFLFVCLVFACNQMMNTTFKRTFVILLFQQVLILRVNKTVHFNIDHLILLKSKLNLYLLVERYFISKLTSLSFTLNNSFISDILINDTKYFAILKVFYLEGGKLEVKEHGSSISHLFD